MLEVALAVVGALAVGAVLFLLFGGRPWRRLFSDAHLIELAGTLDRVRAAAGTRVEPERASDIADAEAAEAFRVDPRSATTSAGLRIHCSVTDPATDTGFLDHHISFSHPDGLLAESGCRFLAAFALARCSLPPEAAAVRGSQNLVLHVMFSIAREQSAAFSAHALPVPAKADLPALRAQVGDAGHRLDFARFDVQFGAADGAA